MSKALLVVDVQVDFVSTLGALYVRGAGEVATHIKKYGTEQRDSYDLVIASRDWHTDWSDNGGHFAHEPDYQNSWPLHCIAGSKGAKYAHELFEMGPAHYTEPPPWVDREVLKGQGSPAYSAFQGVDTAQQSLNFLLKEVGIEELDVCGVALDYCVQHTALDAAALGYQTNLLRDLTVPVSWQGGVDAAVEMVKAGITMKKMLDKSPTLV